MSSIHRNIIWTDYQGNKKYLFELENTHLSNLILFVKNKNIRDGYNIILGCIDILESRGIKIDINNLKQIPHKNKEGKLVFWDYTKNKHKLFK